MKDLIVIQTYCPDSKRKLALHSLVQNLQKIRDKYMMVDLYYPNTIGNRFIIHNFKTQFRISDR